MLAAGVLVALASSVDMVVAVDVGTVTLGEGVGVSVVGDNAGLVDPMMKS